jgi:hypothetical protein
MSDPANFGVLLTPHALSISQGRLKDPQKFLEAVRQASDRIDYYADGSILLEGGDSFHRT